MGVSMLKCSQAGCKVRGDAFERCNALSQLLTAAEKSQVMFPSRDCRAGEWCQAARAFLGSLISLRSLGLLLKKTQGNMSPCNAASPLGLGSGHLGCRPWQVRELHAEQGQQSSWSPQAQAQTGIKASWGSLGGV